MVKKALLMPICEQKLYHLVQNSILHLFIAITWCFIHPCSVASRKTETGDEFSILISTQLRKTRFIQSIGVSSSNYQTAKNYTSLERAKIALSNDARFFVILCIEHELRSCKVWTSTAIFTLVIECRLLRRGVLSTYF